jgi:hypothetical protein
MWHQREMQRIASTAKVTQELRLTSSLVSPDPRLGVAAAFFPKIVDR